MQRVDVAGVAPATDGRTRERRDLSGALGTTDVAINHYRVAPGERISGLHAHGDQEEVFVVFEGTATFEALPADAAEDAGREVAVAAGEAIRFAPGDYQSATNASDEPLAVLALGAPPDSEDVRIPLACPGCDHDHVRPTLDAAGAPVLVCPDCGTETAVECPDCGGAAMQAELGDDGAPVSTCTDCGHDSPTL